MIPNGLVRIPKKGLAFGFRDQIYKELTISPKASSFNQSIVPYKIYYETEEFFHVPRGYFLFRLMPRGVVGDFNYSIGSFLRDAEPIVPREGQAELIEAVMCELSSISGYGGAIIESKVASGKTVMALEIARRLGYKTLVFAHNTVLFKQWIEEIQKFFPHWKIGRLQADCVDIKDKDIVLSTVQSMSGVEYTEDVYRDFGLIISDEVHRTPSIEFHKALIKFNARYLIGLTGTIERADNTEHVFKFCIGRVVSGKSLINTMNPIVYFIDAGLSWKVDKDSIVEKNAIDAAKKGRNVLVLTSRVNKAKNYATSIRNKSGGISVGLLIGEKSEADREREMRAQIIVATFQLIDTGFNEPRLDTLIMADPMNLEQAIGRIQREYKDKKTPMVIDIVNSQSLDDMRNARERYRFYRSMNWNTKGESILGIQRKENQWKRKVSQ